MPNGPGRASSARRWPDAQVGAEGDRAKTPSIEHHSADGVWVNARAGARDCAAPLQSGSSPPAARARDDAGYEGPAARRGRTRLSTSTAVVRAFGRALEDEAAMTQRADLDRARPAARAIGLRGAAWPRHGRSSHARDVAFRQPTRRHRRCSARRENFSTTLYRGNTRLPADWGADPWGWLTAFPRPARRRRWE